MNYNIILNKTAFILMIADNLDANVVDCYAYDGTREVFQKLIDDNGCPLDETIMPSLELIKYENEISTDVKTDWFPEMNRSKFGREYVGDKKKIKSEKSEEKKGIERKKLSDVESEGETEKKSRFMVMGTIFSAFKFPDTSNLHLRCTLLICRKSCPRVSEKSHLSAFKIVYNAAIGTIF